MIRVPHYDDIDYLVSRKFPSSFTAESEHEQSDSEQFMSNENRRIAGEARKSAIKKYEAELREMPKAEVLALIVAERKRHQAEIEAANAREEAQYFFHAPNAEADFIHWGQLANWELEEAVALSFGKAPEVVTAAKLKTQRRVTHFHTAFQKRMQLVERARASRQLFFPVRPKDFVVWAIRLEIDLPEELKFTVNRFDPLPDEWRSKYESEAEAHSETQARLNELNAQLEGSVDRPGWIRERESLLKMIIGMAVEKFGYDPKAAKSPTTDRIATALRTHGISLDGDTVRKYLHDARELLPLDKTE